MTLWRTALSVCRPRRVSRTVSFVRTPDRRCAPARGDEDQLRPASRPRHVGAARDPVPATDDEGPGRGGPQLERETAVLQQGADVRRRAVRRSDPGEKRFDLRQRRSWGPRGRYRLGCRLRGRCERRRGRRWGRWWRRRRSGRVGVALGERRGPVQACRTRPPWPPALPAEPAVPSGPFAVFEPSALPRGAAEAAPAGGPAGGAAASDERAPSAVACGHACGRVGRGCVRCERDLGIEAAATRVAAPSPPPPPWPPLPPPPPLAPLPP